MDGPTTFRELRKNPSTAKIPVLLLTAKVQERTSAGSPTWGWKRCC